MRSKSRTRLKLRGSTSVCILFALFTFASFQAKAQNPTFVSAQIPADNPNRVVVTFSKGQMNEFVVAGAGSDGFTILVEGTPATVTNLRDRADNGAIAATDFWITLSAPIRPGQTITISYDGTGSAESYTGATLTGTLQAFGAQAITNNVTPITTTPAPGAVNVTPSANLYINFNGTNVQAGSGDIIITPVAGGAPINIAVGSAQVNISGDVVTVNPTADLSINTEYKVTFADGVFQTTNNVDLAGIRVEEWKFTTGSTAISISSFSPLDEATNVPEYQNIVITYSDDIVANTGDIVITPSAGAPVIISITDNSQVSIVNNVLTINPASDLLGSTAYEVTMAAGVVQKLVDKTDAPAISTGQLNFTTDAIAVTFALDSYSPADGSSDIAVGSNIVISYNASIVPETTGNIVITPTAPVGPDIIIGITDNSQITVTNNMLIINPTADLAPNTSYRVTMAAGVVKRASDNTPAPVIASGDLNFSTAITLVSLSPVNNSTDVAIGTPFVITYDANIEQGGGNLKLKQLTAPTGSTNIGSGTLTYSGTSATINPTLAANTRYEIIIGSGKIDAVSGAAGAGATVQAVTTGQWVFTTESGVTRTSTTPNNFGSNLPAGTTTMSITYSADVQKGTGDITFTNLTTGVPETIPVSSTSITTNTVTITTSALLANTRYQVEIPTGAFLAAGGANAPVGGVAAGDWTFTTASTINVTALTPSNNSVDVATTTNLVIDFSGNVRAGSGNVIIKPITPTGPDINLDITTSATISGSQVTFPNVNLNPNTLYQLIFSDGVLLDDAGANGYVGGVTSGNWRFTTVSGITISSTNPLDNATNVALSTNPLITYSADIQKGTGNVTIKPINPSAPATVLPISDANITIQGGNQLLITLPDFDLSTEYEITIDDGAVKAANQAQAGITGITAGNWTFTTLGGATITAPTVNACVGGGYVTIDPIVISESSSSSFSIGNNQTLILTVPSNFEMEAGIGSVITTGGEVINASITVAVNLITVKYDVLGTAGINSMILSGLRVKANTAGPGDITNNGTGSAVQEGNILGTVHATLASPARPSAPAVSNAAFSFCQGTDISAQTVVASGGGSYVWYSDAALTSVLYTSDTPNLITNLGASSANAGATTYYVTRNDGTCESTATPVTVTINAKPSASLVSSDADGVICSGETIVFTAIATPSSGAVYTFRNGATVLQTGATSTLTSNALTSGNIEVDITLGTCTTTSNTIALTVNPLPVVTYVPPTAVSFPNNQAAAVALSDGDATTPTFGGAVGGSIVGLTAGTYSGDGVIGSNFYPNLAKDGDNIITFTYIDGTTQCSNSVTFVLSVYDPNGAIDGLSATYCEGKTASGTLTPATVIFPATQSLSKTVLVGPTLTPVTATYNKTSFVLSKPVLEAGTLSASAPYSFDPTTSGTATITATVTYTITNTALTAAPYGFPATLNRSASTPTKVNVLPSLVLQGVSNGAKICVDAPTVNLIPKAYSATLASGFTVKYKKDAGAEVPLASNVKSFNPLTLGTGSYEMYFEYTDLSTNCTNVSPSITFTINEVPVPNFTFPSNQKDYCANVTSVVLAPQDGATPVSGSSVVFEIDKNQTGSYSALPAGTVTLNPSAIGVGTHYVRLAYTNADGCTVRSGDEILTIHALPNPNFTVGAGAGSLTYCANINSVTLNPMDGVSAIAGADLNNVVFEIQQNSTGAFIPQTAGDVVFDPSNLGVGSHRFRFTYTNGNTCSDVSAIQTVKVYALPVPNFAEGNLSRCEDATAVKLTLRDGANNLITNQLNNASIEIQVGSAGGFITPPAGSITKTVATSTVTVNPNALGATLPGSPHQIRFTYVNANGCAETSPVLDLTVNALPTPNLTLVAGSPPFAFCVSSGQQELLVRDATTPLTDTQLAGASFEIDKGSGFTINKGEVVVVADKAYIVPSVLGASSGTPHKIRFSYADGNTCKAISTNLEVTINPLPKPNIASVLPGGYCVDVTNAVISIQDHLTTLSAPQLGNATFWLKIGSGAFAAPPAGAITITGTTVEINPNIIGVGTHQLKFDYVDDNTCTTTSSPVTIRVNALPDPNFTGLNASGEYCPDNGLVTLLPKNGTAVLGDLTNVTFAINTNGGGWQNNPGSITINIASNTVTFNPAVAGAGTHELRFAYADANGCSNTSPTETVTIHPLPQPNFAFASGQTSYCVDAANPQIILRDNLTQLTSAQLAHVVFEIQKNKIGTFKDAAGEINIDQVNNVVDLNPGILGVGTHNIRFRYTDKCLETSGSTEVIIRNFPLPTINNIAKEYCVSNTSAKLVLQDNGSNINITLANVTFKVDVGKTGTFTTPVAGSITPVVGSHEVDINPSLFPVGVHSVNYTYVDPNTCKSVSGNYDITITPLPQPEFIGLNATASYCDNITKVTLTPFDGGSLITPASDAVFSYRRKGTSAYANFTSGNNTFNPSEWGAGEYEIIMEYTNSANCSNVSATPTTVIIQPTPKNVKITATKDYNKNEVVFSSSATGADATWTWDWSFGDATTANTQNLTKKLGDASQQLINYSLSVTTPSGCNTTISKVFKMDFAFEGQCIGTNTKFTKTLNLDRDNVGAVTWDFGDGSAILTGTAAAQADVYHAYQTSGTYWVTMSITTDDGIATYKLRRRIDIFPVKVVTAANFFVEDFEATAIEGWVTHGTVAINQLEVDSTSWRLKQPDGIMIDASKGKAWITDNRDATKATLNANYYNNEQSYVETPCFDISALSKPALSFNYWSHTDAGADGVVVQYTIDDGKTWYRLGTKDAQIKDWYNTIGILGTPGSANSTTNINANEGSQGWSFADSTWQLAQYSLSGIFSTTAVKKMIRFRVAFGSNGDNPSDKQFDGFAFDNFKISNRNRTLLMEYFINDAVTNADVLDKEAKDFQNDGSSSEIVSIHYHTGFPGPDALNNDNKKDPSARSFYYGVAQAPQMIIDGDASINDLTTGELFFKQRVLAPSSFAIDIPQPTISGTSMNVKATITTREAFDRPVFIHVVVVDSAATASNKVYYNVVRKMLPDAAGTYRSAAWASGEVQNLDLNWDMGTLKLGTFRVVVFVQDYETREIHQAGVSSFMTSRKRAKEGENESEYNVTSTGNNVLKHGMKLYPNPVVSHMQVTLDAGQSLTTNAQWEVSSVTGAVFRTGIWKRKTSSLSVDVRDLAAGVYLLKVYDKNRVFMLRFEKQ